MNTLFLDLAHLARNIRRSPASAMAAVLTLSLTLGVGGAIFAVVHAVVLTPPPFHDPHTLFLLGEQSIHEPTEPPRTVTYVTYESWRERIGSRAVLEAIDGTNVTLTGLGLPERIAVNDVTPGFLPLLGAVPALGRGFVGEDVAQRVIVLSDSFWRKKLAADPAVIGREIVLGGQPYNVIGVLPRKFAYELSPADAWRPIPIMPAEAQRPGYRVQVVARLSAAISSLSLEDALDEVSRASSPPVQTVARPITQMIAGDATRSLTLLAGAAAFALLIAYTNFASLLIVRSMERKRELSIRMAVGAGRSEIAKQLLLEAQSLVALGVAGGVLLAVWITPFVTRELLIQFGGLAQREVAVSWPVIGLLTLGSSACASICAIAPALVAMRGGVVDALRRRTTAAPRELLLRRLLVTIEVALAFVLLMSVALLGRNLFRILTVDPGFDPQRVLVFQVSLPRSEYNTARAASFYARIQHALDERLGSASTAVVSELPLAGSVTLTGVGARANDAVREAVVREASANYFRLMRIPVLAGRVFEASDDGSAPLRAVISKSLSDELFPSVYPIGRQVRFGRSAQLAEIVGVVGDVKHRALDEATVPTLYFSTLQSPSHSSIVVVRAQRADSDVVAAARETVAQADPELPVYRVRTMNDVVAGSRGVPARRVVTATFTALAILALALAAVGLFGVVAHDVAARRPELALRLALGAAPAGILRATFTQGLVVVGIGLLAGGVLSVWFARVLRSAAFVTERLDVLSVALPALTLFITAALAILPVASHAARTDPLIALRAE